MRTGKGTDGGHFRGRGRKHRAHRHDNPVGQLVVESPAAPAIIGGFWLASESCYTSNIILAAPKKEVMPQLAAEKAERKKRRTVKQE